MANNTKSKKRDAFAHDEDEILPTSVGIESILSEEERAIQRTRIAEASELRELEHNSLYFKGIVPGARTSEISEEPGWTEMSAGQLSADVIFPLDKIKKRQEASCRNYLTEPHYAAVIDAFYFFIIGKGIRVSAQDENPEVQDYLDDFMRTNQMNDRDRDLVLKVLKSGECFVRFFTKGINGQKARVPVIRFLNFWEITGIKRDEKDREKIISYTRSYRTEGYIIEEEEIPAEEMHYIKFGSQDSSRGLPPFMVIIQACIYYSDWLFHRIVLNRMKTSYYMEEIIKGGTPTDVGTLDNATPNADKVSKSGQIIKRMPKPGSKLSHNEAVEYKWLSPDVKADDAKEDGRAIRLQICAGAQCPEFVLGDASNAAYASTLVSQNPFIRKVEWFQDFFETHFKEIFRRVIQYGIDSKFLPSLSTETVMRERASDVGFIRRVRKWFALNEQFDDKGNIVSQKKIPTKTDVDIQWPTLVAQKMLEDTQAYQLQQSMGIVSDETIAQKLGYDFAEEKRKMAHQDREEKDKGNEEEPFGGEDRDDEINQPDNDDDEGIPVPPNPPQAKS